MTYRLKNGIKIPYVNSYGPTGMKHLTEDIFVKYLDTLMRRKISNSACSVTFTSSNEYFVKLDIPNLTVSFSNDIHRRFKECIQDPQIVYFIVPFHIRFPTYYGTDSEGDRLGHANTVLIDKSEKTIELFEPHGQRFRGHPLYIDTHLLVRETVKKVFPFTQDYSFRSAFDNCAIAPQRNDRFCLAWTLLYIELRLLNGNRFPTQTLFQEFNDNFNESQRADYIKKYVTSVTKKVVRGQIATSRYPDFHLPFRTLDPFIQDHRAFKVRMVALMYLYTTISDESKRNDIFTELINYRKYSRFEKTFFEFFNGRYENLITVFKENPFLFDQLNDAPEFARMTRALYDIKMNNMA